MMKPLTLLLMLALCGQANSQYLADATRTAVHEDPFDAGTTAYRAGDYATAIAYYTIVIERDAQHINAYLQRGFCQSLMKNYDKAVADFTAVVDRKPDHLWAYLSRGSAYNKLAEFDLAKADFSKVLAMDPRNEEAFNNRGWAHKGNGDLKAACSDWRSSQKLGNAEARIILNNTSCK